MTKVQGNKKAFGEAWMDIKLDLWMNYEQILIIKTRIEAEDVFRNEFPESSIPEVLGSKIKWKYASNNKFYRWNVGKQATSESI